MLPQGEGINSGRPWILPWTALRRLLFLCASQWALGQWSGQGPDRGGVGSPSQQVPSRDCEAHNPPPRLSPAPHQAGPGSRATQCHGLPHPQTPSSQGAPCCGEAALSLGTTDVTGQGPRTPAHMHEGMHALGSFLEAQPSGFVIVPIALLLACPHRAGGTGRKPG